LSLEVDLRHHSATQRGHCESGSNVYKMMLAGSHRRKRNHRGEGDQSISSSLFEDARRRKPGQRDAQRWKTVRALIVQEIEERACVNRHYGRSLSITAPLSRPDTLSFYNPADRSIF
jgi:hypothetical protein